MDHRRLRFSAPGLAAALIALGLSACQSSKEEPTPATAQTASPALANQSPDDLKAPLAKVNDVVITVGEFQERINGQSPYLRARYNSLEQKKEFLDNLIRVEVLAKEAYARGYDKNPDVVRTMKQVMIQKLMKDEFQEKFKPEDIAESELQAFYDAHSDEFNKPEEVRVSAIVLTSKADADKVAREALGETGKTNKGFRQLVNQHSTDEATKIRGGDLKYFNREEKALPAPLIEASFALPANGAVAGPVDGKDGKFYVIKQTGRRRAVSKPLAAVKKQIQNRVYRDKRTEAQKNFIDGLRKNSKVETFDANLDKVLVDTTAPAGDPHGHGAPGNMPGAPAPGDPHGSH